MKLFFVCAAACLSGSCASSVLGQRSVLASAMQPDVVAKTLSAVQGEWKAQVAIFTDCDSTTKPSRHSTAFFVNCKDARSAFTRSCGTISNAIVQGSGGDKDIMKEYMGDVCRQRAMSGWHQLQCNSVALAIGASMSADKNQNRINFKSARSCDRVWAKLLGERTQEVAKEKADHEAAEKKAAEETAEEDRLRLEAQKKEKERKKAEKVEREKQEAADKAAEAKAKAAEAAAQAAEKKAEAKAAAASAKQKMSEVAADKQKQEAAAAKAVEKVPVQDVKKTETKPVSKADAKPKVVAAAAKPEAIKKVLVEPVKAAKKKTVAAKVGAETVAKNTAKFLVSAAAPAAAAAGAPKAAGAPGGAAEILNGKMSLKAAEQGFAGKMVKHSDGKTAAADWQNEYSTKGASFLASAAAPAPAAAGAPKAAGAPGGAKVNLNDKMPLKAAEQGFTGKQVKHSDGKTAAADWQKEYGHAK